MVAASGTRHGNIFWDEEKGNVGLRMMQGMGWEHGKGLGSKGHGITTHIRVRHKKDNAGIGANASTADDAWKATQDVFNSILTRLNDSDAVAEVEKEEKETKSTPTIKQTMVRHQLYRKFRQGKNASAYSATDMAMIFGKRTDERAEAAVEHGDSAVDSGHQTTTSTICMKTYFAARMRAATGGEGVGATGGFTEEFQTAFAEEMTQRAECYTGRKGLGFGGGARGHSPERERAAPQAPRAPPAPVQPAAPAAAAAAAAAAKPTKRKRAQAERPAEREAEREGKGDDKPNWKRAMRSVMKAGGGESGEMKLKAFRAKLLEHFGGAVSAESVDEALERKAAKAGFAIDGKRIRRAAGDD